MVRKGTNSIAFLLRTSEMSKAKLSYSVCVYASAWNNNEDALGEMRGDNVAHTTDFPLLLQDLTIELEILYGMPYVENDSGLRFGDPSMHV